MPTWNYETPRRLRLDLELPAGQMAIETIEGTTATRVDLEALTPDGEDLIRDARVDLVERGDGHEVRVEVKARMGLFISFTRGPHIRLRVACPPGPDAVVRTKSADIVARGRFADVEVKTASGDVSVQEVAGDARVKTASGDVSIEEVHGTTQVQSASGDFALQRAHGDVTAQLVSGDLWVKDADGSIHANTVSGDQRIDAVADGAVEAHAVSGDILVGVRRGARVYVDANTVSGSTTSELELRDAPAEDGGDGADDDARLVEVRARTVSGDISIVRAAARTQLPAS